MLKRVILLAALGNHKTWRGNHETDAAASRDAHQAGPGQSLKNVFFQTMRRNTLSYLWPGPLDKMTRKTSCAPSHVSLHRTLRIKVTWETAGRPRPNPSRQSGTAGAETAKMSVQKLARAILSPSAYGKKNGVALIR